ncbi:unnamed protein product [Prunus armeniaca]|uniref:Uncharacterized protein n=1 Tax=Prunus armeniaca TaxID=36596 RepID=A0A6J5WEL0_PRUAR|nr:unnamed protein product [Prunus armeniaca]
MPQEIWKTCCNCHYPDCLYFRMHACIAINQAIRETDEDDEVDMPIDEKPALPRTRNRPKREV